VLPLHLPRRRPTCHVRVPANVSSKLRIPLSVIIAAAALMMIVGVTGAVSNDGAKATSAAGMTVDTGTGEPIHVVVTFEGESITALELLRAADLDLVSVDFGGLGEAVCEIARTGCDVNACRQRVCQTSNPDSPFWQFWHQDEVGHWALSPLGASRATVEHGGIVAWIWSGPLRRPDPVTWRALVTRSGAPDVLASGPVSGEPTVYRSEESRSATTDGPANTMAAAGVITAVGMVGVWLVLRHRVVLQGRS
jgi:hypothetical protein